MRDGTDGITITRVLLACSLGLLWGGCDSECPDGFKRRGDVCAVEAAPRDAGTGSSEKDLSTKEDASALDPARDAAAPSGGHGGDGDQVPAANGGAGGAANKQHAGGRAAPQADAGPAAAVGGSGGQPAAMQPASTAAASDTPSFVSGGGPVLKHPDVALLFWGPAWAGNPAVTPGQIAGALQHMFVGPYFANLNQYGDLVRPSLTWVSVDSTTALPSADLSTQDIASYINARLDANAAPPLGGEQLLVVVLPPGAAPDRAQGERGTASYKDASYRYAWVASGSTLSDASSATYTIARHVIGSMTNPSGNGWTDANSGKELTDVCGWTLISGMAQPQYWSNADARCVVPREYASLLRYDGMPNAWTPIWSRVRFAACGGFGLVATNADDNIFKYSGQPDSWLQIGLPGALHVVGSDAVFGLTTDLAGTFRYSGSGLVWDRIGEQYVNIYAGGLGVFATELGSNRLKKWSGDSPTSTSWTDFGNSGASFAVGKDFVAGVPPNHSSVWRAKADASWTQIKTTGTNQLFSSGSSSYLAATDRTDLDSIFLYEGDTSWARQGDPGYAFALTEGELFGLTPSRWKVFQSTDLAKANPDWSAISDPVLNLVPGCASSLYALNGLIQCDEGVRGTVGSSCSTTIGP